MSSIGGTYQYWGYISLGRRRFFDGRKASVCGGAYADESHLEFDEVGQLGFAEDIGQLEAVIERGVRPFERNVFKHRQRVADDDRVALERVLGEFV